MRLILIRHGKTCDNLKRKYSGIRDIGLTRVGWQEAKKIEEKIKGLKVDRVFCSDLKRSWQTAEIIFSNRTCKIIKNPHLREINFGIWEGLTYSQILKRFPAIYKKWLADPFSMDIPSGQRLSSFIQRIKKELRKIVNSNKKQTVALVTHSGVIRVILNTSQDIKRSYFWRLKINPSAVYIIEYKGKLKPKIYTL
jgi:alpha-ribazole phosphatase